MKTVLRLALTFSLATCATAGAIAYDTTTGGLFGVLDLDSGAFNPLGVSQVGLAGLGEIDGTYYGEKNNGNTLYIVSAADGSLTQAGRANGLTFTAFGSTNSQLFAYASNNKLYAIDPATGAATLAGNTGLTGASALSTGSDVLYLTSGASPNGTLYTVDTLTGLATILGSAGAAHNNMNGLVVVAGALYGATGPSTYMLNILSGTSTFDASLGSLPRTSGLAPVVPEPESIVLTGAFLLVLSLARCPRNN